MQKRHPNLNIARPRRAGEPKTPTPTDPSMRNPKITPIISRNIALQSHNQTMLPYSRNARTHPPKKTLLVSFHGNTTKIANVVKVFSVPWPEIKVSKKS